MRRFLALNENLVVGFFFSENQDCRRDAGAVFVVFSFVVAPFTGREKRIGGNIIEEHEITVFIEQFGVTNGVSGLRVEDFRNQIGDFRLCIKLPSLLAAAGGEVFDQKFVGVADDINNIAD